MVVKNRAEDETPFSALPPRVSSNETYMSDAVSSILSSFQKSAKKKQEIPRHPGGIWDIDDAMDVTESSAMELRKIRTDYLIDRDRFRQQLYMMDTFENSSLKFLDVEDIMDTREPHRSESASFAKPEEPLEIEDIKDTKKTHMNDSEFFGKSALRAEFGEIKNVVSSKNQSEKLKKKNSEESFVEGSKRCRTSSITEVYPPVSVATDDTRSVGAVKGFLSINHPSVQTQKKDVATNEENNDCHEFAKNSQISSDVEMRKVEVVKSSKEVGKLYQKEINVLRRVTSIFESFAGGNPPGIGVSYSVEVEHLQRICRILKRLESSDSHLSNDTNPKIPGKDVNVPVICSGGKKMLSGEAVSLNDVQCNEPKPIESGRDACNGFKDASPSSEFHNGSENNTNDVPFDEHNICTKTVPIWKQNRDKKSDDLSKSSQVENSNVSVCSRAPNAEKESSSIAQANLVMEKILNGTLPWGPSGSPPPTIAFSGASGQIVNDASVMVQGPTLPLRAMNATSPSKAMDSASSRAIDTTLSAKVNSTPSSKTMDAFLPLVAPDKILPLKAMEPNEVLEKIINGTLPWGPRGSAPPAIEFSGASSNDGMQSGIVATVSTSPSRSTDVVLQYKAVGTTTNAMDTRLSSKAMTPPKALDVGTPSKEKEQESVEEAAFFSKDNEAAKSDGARLLPSTSSASPTKYIAPPKRNCNEPQAGRIYERSSPLRPILPWRANGASPRRHNEGIQSGRTSASQWRAKNGTPPSGNGGDIRNDSNWQNWRTKVKSPLKQHTVTKNNLNGTIMNSGYCHDQQMVKETHPIPNEYSERHSQQEEKVLNVEQESVSGSKPSEDLDAMISVKIFSEESALVEELMVPSNELIRMKRKFPNLYEVVPRADEQDKVLEQNANAVKVFLRCVFSMSYTLPCWEIALEAFALAKKFSVEKLQDACKVIFDNKPIYPGQVQDIVHLARKHQITDVLKTSLMFAEVQAYHISDATIQVNTKKPHCSVSCIASVEPSEFHIPLFYMKEKGLGSTRESDIKNNIIFEADSGSFCITGFQVKLEAESRDLGKEISIFCDVFKSDRMVFGEERRKPLNNMMIINFKQKLLVAPKESVTISVLIEDVCLRMCHCLLREKKAGRCSTGSFETTFTSDRKTQAKQSLFFVEKLFYTYEGQKY